MILILILLLIYYNSRYPEGTPLPRAEQNRSHILLNVKI
jgi:hypothetical protein